jgi:hypothetical protein
MANHFIDKACKFMNAPITVALTLFCIYWYSNYAFALLYKDMKPKEVDIKIHLVGSSEVVQHQVECTKNLAVKLKIEEE